MRIVEPESRTHHSKPGWNFRTADSPPRCGSEKKYEYARQLEPSAWPPPHGSPDAPQLQPDALTRAAAAGAETAPARTPAPRLSTCPLLRKHRQRQPQHRNRDYPNSSHSSTSLYRPVTMPTQRRMRLSPHRFQEPPLPVRILSRSSKLSLDSVALRLFFTRHSVRARPVTEPPPRDGLCQTISLANDFAPSYISN